MINKINAICLFLTVITSLIWAKNIDVVVIGITHGGSPAFDETLDKKLREKLSNTHELFIADYQQTQYYRRKINFNESPTVSRNLIESLKQYCTDSTIFVWGEIKNCAMKGVRKNFIFGYIKGEMTISLNIYSMRNKNVAFSGDVTAEFEKKKELIFFGSAENEIIASAIDKNEIMEKLLDNGAQNSAKLISTVIKSEILHAAKDSTADTNKISSASGKSGPDSGSVSNKTSVKMKDSTIKK